MSTMESAERQTRYYDQNPTDMKFLVTCHCKHYGFTQLLLTSAAMQVEPLPFCIQ